MNEHTVRSKNIVSVSKVEVEFIGKNVLITENTLFCYSCGLLNTCTILPHCQLWHGIFDDNLKLNLKVGFLV